MIWILFFGHLFAFISNILFRLHSYRCTYFTIWRIVSCRVVSSSCDSIFHNYETEFFYCNLFIIFLRQRSYFVLCSLQTAKKFQHFLLRKFFSIIAINFFKNSLSIIFENFELSFLDNSSARHRR